MTHCERIVERFQRDTGFAPSSLLFLGYAGSKAHGTYVPPTDSDAIDDVDVLGVYLPPRDYTIGLRASEHWITAWEEMDVAAYSLHKYARLCLKGNPNVLGSLWLRQEDILFSDPIFAHLRGNRDLFAHKGVYTAFAGYANGQMTRMTSYTPAIQKEIDDLTEWLGNAGWLVSEIMDGRPLPMPKGISADKANEWAARLKHLRAKYHAAYMGEKRRGLVLRYGYDTKNAAHLIRLLLMCREFMDTGEMQVFRTEDAGMLRDIKSGKWDLEAVKFKAEELFGACREARDRSRLPDGPDEALVSRLVANITMYKLRQEYEGEREITP